MDEKGQKSFVTEPTRALTTGGDSEKTKEVEAAARGGEDDMNVKVEELSRDDGKHSPF